MGTRRNAGDKLLSRVRVARGTLIGVRECLADAVTFCDRGINDMDTAYREIDAALKKAGQAAARARKPKVPHKRREAAARHA